MQRRFIIILGFIGLVAVTASCGRSNVSLPIDAEIAANLEQTDSQKPSLREINLSLVNAIKWDKPDDVDQLLSEGASVEAENRYGLKVIFIASKFGNPAIITSLINASANVNETVETTFNDDGVGYTGTMAGTPLSYAALEGRVEAMATLIKAGAEVNGLDPEGNMPLMRAAEGGHLPAVEWLLDQGANETARAQALKSAQMIFNPDENRQAIVRVLQPPK